MRGASEQQDYERAALWRDRIAALRRRNVSGDLGALGVHRAERAADEKRGDARNGRSHGRPSISRVSVRVRGELRAVTLLAQFAVITRT